MILKSPDPKLSKVCTKCTFEQGRRIGGQLLAEIKKASDEFDPKYGTIVGLAAPQIGYTVRVFVAFNEVFINPVILKVSSHMVPSREGCLSLPDHAVGYADRPSVVSLQWITINRKMRRFVFNDSAATIVLHEMDHLQGRMIG
jgi:peptide deformylase